MARSSSAMSTQSAYSEDYGDSDKSIDPFDSDHDLDIFDMERGYEWLGPGGDVCVLGPAVSLETKKRVKAVDPCKGHCLITNATPDSGIKYTHCLPLHLARDSVVIRRLEWYWGMREGELDLNTEYNIFPASAQLSAMHEYPRKAPSWFLIPEDHIVDMFFSRTRKFNMAQEPCKEGETHCYSRTWRGNLPALQEKTYRYRLVPMYLRMEGMALTYIQHPPFIHRPTVSDVTTDVHPFDNLPWVTSHLDPKFVIMEAGRKMSKMESYSLKWGNHLFGEWFNARPALRSIFLLYEAWSARTPSEGKQDFGFVPPVVSDMLTPTANLHPREPDQVVPRDPHAEMGDGRLDRSAIVQWSIDTYDQGIPPDLVPSENLGEDQSAVPESDSQIMDSDEDSQFDFTIGAGSRTPPRRLILSKDGKHWY